VLVDDVLFTGRTIRAALDALGESPRRPRRRCSWPCMVDRGHPRELPIRPDYVGKNVPTSLTQRVKLRLVEDGGARHRDPGGHEMRRSCPLLNANCTSNLNHR
jgi:pyrimidine operon attenuation protein/uracil phosphoribosyltransferase